MKIWIYLDGRQQGPFELVELLDMPGMNENTKVWFEGLARWYPAGALEEMRPLFDGSLAGARAKAVAEAEHAETPAQVIAGEQADGEAADEQRQAETEEKHQEEAVLDDIAAEAQYEAPQTAYAPGRIYVSRKPEGPCPPSYLGWSIFLTVCCCSPVSLAALVSSICTSSFFMRGDARKARKASEVTAWLIMIAFALGMIPAMLTTIFFGN